MNILGVLLLDNIHSVVYGDDTHQSLLQVYYRQRQKVVFAQLGSCLLLVAQGIHIDHIGLHKRLDPVVLIVEQQFLHGGHAQQMAGGVCYIAGINGLFVHTGAANALKSVLHGHIPL